MKVRPYNNFYGWSFGAPIVSASIVVFRNYYKARILRQNMFVIDPIDAIIMCFTHMCAVCIRFVFYERTLAPCAHRHTFQATISISMISMSEHSRFCFYGKSKSRINMASNAYCIFVTWNGWTFFFFSLLLFSICHPKHLNWVIYCLTFR